MSLSAIRLRKPIRIVVLSLIAATLGFVLPIGSPAAAAPAAYTATFETGEPGETNAFGGGSAVETSTLPGGAAGTALMFTKGNEVWSGVSFLDEPDTVTLARNGDTVTARVYGDTGTVVKLEIKHTTPPAWGYQAWAAKGFNETKTQAGWETLTWTLSDVGLNYHYYDVASFIPDVAQGTVLYFDNVTFPRRDTYATAPAAKVVTYEVGDTSGYDTSTYQATATIEAPPSGGPANSSAALKVVKTSGQAGAVIVLLNTGANLMQPVISTTSRTVSFNVYAASGTVIKVVEQTDGNEGNDSAVKTITTTDSGWQTLSATFDAWTSENLSPRNKLAFNFNDGGAAGTFYLDNIAINGASTGVIQGPRAFTLTNASSVSGAYTSAVSGQQTAGAMNFVTLSAPNGYFGTVSAYAGAYLKVSGSTLAPTGTNVTVDAAQTRADLVASGVATSVNLMYPKAETVTAQFVTWSSTGGVVTETVTQTITVSPAPAPSDNVVSAAKSTTVLRSHWTNWDPAQTKDDAVVLGLSGSDSPAYIEGHVRDSAGTALSGKKVLVSATGPVTFKVRKYESPYSDLSGTGLRYVLSDTLTTDAFVVEISRDGTGNFGTAVVSMSVDGTLIGQKTLKVTGPVSGVKGTVSQSRIAAVPASVTGYLTPNGSETLTTSAIGFVAADSNGSISYDGYEATTVATSDATIATATLGSDVYGNRFVNLRGLAAGTVKVTLTNAAGTAFELGSVEVVAPVIATLKAEVVGAVTAGGKATIKLTANTADGKPVPNGTYTLSAGNWASSVATTSVVSGAHKFVDGVSTFEVWAPLTPGPMTLDLTLGSNAILSTSLQGKPLSVAVTVGSVASTAATTQAAAITALQSQLATLQTAMNSLVTSLTSQIKALALKLQKLTLALSKR